MLQWVPLLNEAKKAAIEQVKEGLVLLDNICLYKMHAAKAKAFSEERELGA